MNIFKRFKVIHWIAIFFYAGGGTCFILELVALLNPAIKIAIQPFDVAIKLWAMLMIISNGYGLILTGHFGPIWPELKPEPE